MQSARNEQPKGPKPRRKGLISSLLYYRNFATDPFAFVEKRFEEFGDIYRAQNPDGSYLYVAWSRRMVIPGSGSGSGSLSYQPFTRVGCKTRSWRERCLATE